MSTAFDQLQDFIDDNISHASESELDLITLTNKVIECYQLPISSSWLEESKAIDLATGLKLKLDPDTRVEQAVLEAIEPKFIEISPGQLQNQKYRIKRSCLAAWPELNQLGLDLIDFDSEPETGPVFYLMEELEPEDYSHLVSLKPVIYLLRSDTI